MVDFDKSDGLVPVIIQDAETFQVLMLGYMNEEALEKTRSEGVVTFFSRSKQRLWTKGETSGNTLSVQKIYEDCDNDALLILAKPAGPICHTGTPSCFAEDEVRDLRFLGMLEKIIADRIEAGDSDSSYTARLGEAGLQKIAQKIGEEGVEVALATVSENDASFCNEVADLLFHLFVACRKREVEFSQVASVLADRSLK